MSNNHIQNPTGETEEYSVVVIGAGMGGIYALHRFAELGHDVHGFEGADGVGGVWYHNAYPGARVDLESHSYAFMFDPELYAGWDWSERYAAQPEILRYLNYVADRLEVRRNLSLSTWVTSADWHPTRTSTSLRPIPAGRFGPAISSWRRDSSPSRGSRTSPASMISRGSGIKPPIGLKPPLRLPASAWPS